MQRQFVGASVLACCHCLLLVSAMRMKANSTDSVESEADGQPLCSGPVVQETCRILTGGPGDGLVSAGTVGDMLLASPADTRRLWERLALVEGPGGGDLGGLRVTCGRLCAAAVARVKEEGVLPPSTDIACYSLGAASYCDLDVAPADLAGLGPKQGENLPDFHDEQFLKRPGAPVPELVPPGLNSSAGAAPALLELAEAGRGGGDDWELLERLANLFRIYPARKPVPAQAAALLEVPSRNRWCDGCELANKQKETLAKAYVAGAMRAFKDRRTEAQMKRWFGKWCFSATSCRREVLRVLTSVHHMLSNVEYIYPAQECARHDQLFAYVYPDQYDCPPQYLPHYPCTKTQGKFVFYLCPKHFRNPSEMVMTLVHEGSHHATALTDDVLFNGKQAYGRKTCQALARKDPLKALKNADNFCYYVQDVEEEVSSKPSAE